MRVLALCLVTLSLCAPSRLFAEEIATGKSGNELIAFIRAHYRPTNSLSYGNARQKMFESIDNVGGKVRCVYTGVEVSTTGIPENNVMNTEHTWPQSKFHEQRPMKTDLHHLFPTLSKVNQVRGNLPFAEIPDAQTRQWWHSNTAESHIPSSSEIDQYSESGRDAFEPREDHKGNVARAMIYFWVVYGADDISASWAVSQLPTLADWHTADPIDEAEISRTRKIGEVQGNVNPFILDPTLVQRVLPTLTPGRTEVAASIARAASAAHVEPESMFGSGKGSHRFPDFKLEYRPTDAEYPAPLFRLSQDYPEELPPIDDGARKILEIPFNDNTSEENCKRYLLAVRDYCLEGNIEVDWQGQDNKVRHWYHVPWQHYGEKGREGIHGMTREATAKPRQLHPNQQGSYQTYAVAMYNDIGGYTIGRVWKNQFEPDPTAAKFPVGTVVVKILFTLAKSDEVPHLQDPVIWKGYVQDPRDANKRSVQKLRLLQMDVMVRDERAQATGGWVFGNYCYNGALGNENKWKNLIPVGIQWGNDPDVKSWESNPTGLQSEKTMINSGLKETIINASEDLPAQHLGWGGRLNGPLDYFRSSCMSCHSTAQFPVVAPQHPDFEPKLDYEPGGNEWMTWFRNLPCGESFSANGIPVKRTHSMDFSLQLAIGIDNFYLWKSATLNGYFTPVLPGTTPTSRTETFRPTSESSPLPATVPQQQVQPMP